VCTSAAVVIPQLTHCANCFLTELPPNRGYNILFFVCQFTMSSKPTSTRQAWTEKERDDIRSQHALHPLYSYPDIKRWFDEKYAPKTISKSQISKILNPKRPRGISTTSSTSTQLTKIQPTAAQYYSWAAGRRVTTNQQWCSLLSTKSSEGVWSGKCPNE